MPSTAIALMLAFTPLAADTPQAGSANMLENPGFEEDWDGDGQPDGWYMLTQKGKPEGRRSTERPKAGDGCVFAQTPGPADVGYWSQIVGLKPGMKRFELTASARSDASAQANVSFSAYAHGTRKWLAANYTLIVVKDSPDWQTRTAEFEVPDGTGSVRIALWCNYNRRSGGRVWFDQVTLRPMGYERAPAPGNLAPNADFESVAAPGRLPKAWVFTKSAGTAKPLANCDDPHAGHVSPGIEVGPGGVGILWAWAPMPQGWEVFQLGARVRTDGDVRALGSITVYAADKKKWLAAGYELFDIRHSPRWSRAVGCYQAPAVEGVLKIALWAKAGPKGGSAWFDDVELLPIESVPAKLYVPANPPPQPTGEDRARGFMVFSRNYLDLMPPSYRPSTAEVQKPLAIAAARGEHEPISVGVYALEDIGALHIEPPEFRSDDGAVIPSANCDVRVVRYLVKRSHYGLNDRVLVPTYLERSDTLRVAKEQVGQVWGTVRVPADAAAGEYRGTLTLSRGNAKGQAQVVVLLRVHSFALDAPKGMAFGMYDALQRTVPGPEFMAEKYRDMRSHGMTTVGFCGNLGATLRAADGGVAVEFDGRPALATAMDAYVRAEFPEPIVWLMGSDVRRFCTSLGPLESDAFGNAYKGVIKAVLAEGKRRGWPEIIFQPEDEVFAHSTRFELASRELKLLKEIPDLRTEMDGTNVRPELSDQTYPLTDVLVHCYGPLLYGERVYPRGEWLGMVAKYHADGKRIWFYNVDTTGYHVETMRFAAGLYMLWSNADGLLSWAYSWGDAKPYDDYSGKSGDTIFFYPPRGKRKGGPALGWEGLREGIDDYRYVRTLMNLIEKAGPGRVAQQAKQELESWLARLDLSRLRTNRSMQGNWTVQAAGPEGQPAVGGSFKIDVGISFEDYDRFRSMCARHIEILRRE